MIDTKAGTQPDLIAKVEELLANAPHSRLKLTLQPNGDITAPDGVVVLKVWNGYDNGRLAVAAPDLLRRLVTEVKQERNLLRECLPFVLSAAEASRMMDGFEPQEHKEDRLAARLVDAIGDEALRQLLFKKPEGPFNPDED